MGRKPQKRNSQTRSVTAPQKPKAPRILSSWKELFNDEGFDVGKCISLLLTGSLSKTEEAIALQALIAWIFLAPSPSSAARSQRRVKQAMLIRAAIRLDRKCIRNPSVKITRSMKMFQELHREADAKWLLESIFLPLGGFDELVKCKAITSLTAEVRKRMKLFDDIFPLLTILHFSALTRGSLNSDSMRVSLAEAISIYLEDAYKPDHALCIDGQPHPNGRSLEKKLGARQLKANWADVKDQIGFLYAAHFVPLESGLTLAQYIKRFGISKSIKHDTLVRFLSVVRTFHETVLSEMMNADDWNIEFPSTLQMTEFSVSHDCMEQHETIVRSKLQREQKLVVDTQM